MFEEHCRSTYVAKNVYSGKKSNSNVSPIKPHVLMHSTVRGELAAEKRT